MKNGRFLVLFCFWATAFSASATDVLARRVTLFFREKPIKNALDEVAKQADFEWSYNPKIIDENLRVNLNAQNWTVREALFELLGEGFQFKASGNYLILKKEKPAKSEVSGTLRDPKTGERLANATVYDRRTLRSTVTDSSGFYSLKVKKRSELVVAKLGYRDTVLQVAPGAARFQKIELAQNFPLPEPPEKRPDFKKTVQKSATELESFFAATLDKWTQINVPDTFHRRFQLGFLPKMGTNRGLDAKVENDFSVNILAGQSAGVGKLELAGLGNFTRKNMRGLQVAGLFNTVSGNSSGLELAGLFNKTGDTLRGVQLAGLVNFAQKMGKMGFQAAGLGNFSQKNTRTRGGQLSGLINKTGDLSGIQVAGLINMAESVHGAQVSGSINRARRVHGLQIGFFNNADELHGLQFGLINRSGRRVLPLINLISLLLPAPQVNEAVLPNKTWPPSVMFNRPK